MKIFSLQLNFIKNYFINFSYFYTVSYFSTYWEHLASFIYSKILGHIFLHLYYILLYYYYLYKKFVYHIFINKNQCGIILHLLFLYKKIWSFICHIMRYLSMFSFIFLVTTSIRKHIYFNCGNLKYRLKRNIKINITFIL